MLVMITGLIFLLVPHSVRIFADDWRSKQINRYGERAWKGVYSLISVIGFALIVWGFDQARMQPVNLWQPPLWTRHLASLLTLPSFIFLFAAYVPGNKIKSVLGNPMALSVKLWAFAHLLANGTLADVILFGSFLVWAILDFRTSRRRDKAAGISYQYAGISRDIIVVSIGTIAWGAFAMVLHGWLIGVKPFA